MKRILTFLMAACFYCAAFSTDLNLQNGTILKNVQVLNCSNDGATLLIPGRTDGYTIKQIPYTKFTRESLLKLAEEPGSGLAVWGNIRQNSSAIRLYDRNAAAGIQTGLTPPGLPTYITLDSIQIFGNGTIGWANSNPGFGNNISYGRIFVYGIQIQGMNSWNGTVYPTIKTIRWERRILPCFAVSPLTAEIINRQTYW